MPLNSSKKHVPAALILNKIPRGKRSNVYINPPKDFDIKPSNIRIWIHNEDLKNLQRVIWEGHGKKLQVETSNHPKIKRFLEGVPFMLNIIKDLHSAVVHNDLEEFIKKSSEPIPVQVLDSKDSNGLSPLHKACGLGRLDIANYIIEKNSKYMFSTDHSGRTPLHFAATLKNDNSLYNFLISNGADETTCDKNGKTPHFYKTNSKEVVSKILKVIPEAPRTTGIFPINWDWTLFHSNKSTPTTMVSTSNENEEDNTIQKNNFHSAIIFTPVENSFEKDQQQDFKFKNITKNLNELSDFKMFVNQSSNKDITTKFSKPEKNNEIAMKNLTEEETHLSTYCTKELESSEKDQKTLSKKEVINIFTINNTQESEEKKNYKESIEKQNNILNKNHEENIVEKEEEEKNCDENDLRDNLEPEKMLEFKKIEEKEKVERKIAEERQRLLDETEFLPEDTSQESFFSDEVNKLIEKKDMNALANMVLNGEGEKLLGRKSKNPGIQSFLDNLPSYLAKITAVHEAVRRGSLNALQNALDRRRFAVAKETSNNLGVTPLHLAVLFGKTSIIKYLGGKFPETLNFKDNFGRTPLHYAAILPDKNHFFNILLNLGADTEIKDEAGHTPQFYQQNPDNLKYQTIMDDYTALNHVAKDTVKDKRRINSSIADFSLKETESETFWDEGKPLSKQKVNNTGKISEIVNSQKHFTNNNRDEYGQSILHFAAARIHGRRGLYHLIQESSVSLGFRDELYRTARDIALQANIQSNIKEIDEYVISLAARGETEKLTELFLEGYDHILDVEDDEGNDIITVALKQNNKNTVAFLKAIPLLEEKRDKIHDSIRGNNYKFLQYTCEKANQKLAIIGKNNSGRCSLHVAILCQREDIVEFIAQKFPETLKIGDNLDRTPLHYAMGVDDVETLSKILIKCGAKRILKDIKGRQPTYYFLNKSEILKLQEEENLSKNKM